MKTLSFNKDGEIIIQRKDLKNSLIDIGGRDIFIAFNEPAFKFWNNYKKK